MNDKQGKSIGEIFKNIFENLEYSGRATVSNFFNGSAFDVIALPSDFLPAAKASLLEIKENKNKNSWDWQKIGLWVGGLSSGLAVAALFTPNNTWFVAAVAALGVMKFASEIPALLHSKQKEKLKQEIDKIFRKADFLLSQDVLDGRRPSMECIKEEAGLTEIWGYSELYIAKFNLEEHLKTHLIDFLSRFEEVEKQFIQEKEDELEKAKLHHRIAKMESKATDRDESYDYEEMLNDGEIIIKHMEENLENTRRVRFFDVDEEMSHMLKPHQKKPSY